MPGLPSSSDLTSGREMMSRMITDMWLKMSGKAAGATGAGLPPSELEPHEAVDGVSCLGCLYTPSSSKPTEIDRPKPEPPAPPPDPEPERPQRSADDTIMTMTQLVLPSDSSKEGTLLAGPLLKWIDICACMSAEKFSGVHCVTACMEDIHFMHKVHVGEMVKLSARVYQAWNTSMEVGVTVTIERLGEYDTENVCCHAMSMFVTKEKAKLPVLKFTTLEQKGIGEQANARKWIRTKMPKRQEGEARPDMTEGTTISTELVMPHHCQHMGTTFGGWIMQWMECTASIAAARHTRLPMLCVSTDVVNFLAPSHAGDAVELRAFVSSVWNTTLEVACWASAEDLRAGTSKPICQMYATYSLTEQEVGVMPPLKRPGDAVAATPSSGAYQRRAARLQRKALTQTGGLSVEASAFDQRAARKAVQDLENIAGSKSPDDKVGADDKVAVLNWETLFDGKPHGIPVVMQVVDGYPATVVRITFPLGASPEQVNKAVNDPVERKRWDKIVSDFQPLRRVEVDPKTLGRRGSTLSIGQPVEIDMLRMGLSSGHDAVVARARAVDQAAGRYTSVSRSIKHPDAPADKSDRVEVLPSGWTLQPDGQGGCQACYCLQLGASALAVMLSSMDGKMMTSEALASNLLKAREGGHEASGGMMLATVGNVISLMGLFPPKQ